MIACFIYCLVRPFRSIETTLKQINPNYEANSLHAKVQLLLKDFNCL